MMATIAVLIGLLLPAVQKVREIAARIQCNNNLKQIVLGMHNCHDTHGRLPPGIGFFRGKDSGAYGTGLFHLLPFVEQDNLYKKALAAGPVFSPLDNGVYATAVPVFVCPSDPSAGTGLVQDNQGTTWGASSYAGNVQVFAKVDSFGILSDPQGQTKFERDITDGLSNAILFAEHYARCTNRDWVEGGNLWAYQQLGRTAKPLHPGFEISWTVWSFGPSSLFQVQPGPFLGNCDPTLTSTPHAFMHVGLCDGSVRAVSPQSAARRGGKPARRAAARTWAPTGIGNGSPFEESIVMNYVPIARYGGMLFLLTALAAGCAPAEGEVKGRVLYKGEIVPSGSIIFVSKGGKECRCTINEGDYTMCGVPPGKVQIVVAGHPRVPPGLDNPPGIKKAPGTQQVRKGEKGERWVEIPRRYYSVETSGLSLEVRAGSQKLDIELAP
jgi:hypothetical protein